MDAGTLLLGGIAGGMLGALVGWLLARVRAAATAARLGAELAAERRSGAEKRALLAEAEQRLREAFAALSREALGQNNQSFLDLAKTQLGEFQQGARADLEARHQAVDGLVAPLRESVGAVQLQLAAIEKERHAAYEKLASHLQSAVVTEQALRAEVGRLGGALRAPTARGRWGEIQLQRIVELAGMVEHCDYDTQAQTDAGLRPDMVVHLPGGKRIVIDAKVPLGAYLEALDVADDLVREAKLAEHARQVREHMKRLGGKAYQEQVGGAAEFVVMFLPGEAFFGAALQHDPALIDHGWAQRVIPASPTTLLALLRAVGYGWKQEALAENAREICDQGAELYDRLATMAGYIEKLGKAIGKVVDAHDETIGALERRILPTARRLRELQAASARPLPEPEALRTAVRRVQAEELLTSEAGRQAASPGADTPAEDARPPLRIVAPA